MTKFNQIILSKTIIILLILSTMYYQGIWEVQLLLAVYVPCLFILTYNHRKNKTIEGISNFFKIYTWFLITLFGLAAIGSYFYATEYLNEFSSFLAWFGDATLLNLPKIATALLLVALLIMNKSLDE